MQLVLAAKGVLHHVTVDSTVRRPTCRAQSLQFRADAGRPRPRLYDTNVICEYLDYPHPPLMPVDPLAGAPAAVVRLENDWLTLVDQSGGRAQCGYRPQGTARRLVCAGAGLKFFLSRKWRPICAYAADLALRARPPAASRAQPIIDYGERIFRSGVHA